MSALAAALPVFQDDEEDRTTEEMDPKLTEGQAQETRMPAGFPLIPGGVEPSSFSHLTTASPVLCGYMDKDTVRKKVLIIFPNAGRHIESWKVRLPPSRFRITWQAAPSAHRSI